MRPAWIWIRFLATVGLLVACGAENRSEGPVATGGSANGGALNAGGQAAPSSGGSGARGGANDASGGRSAASGGAVTMAGAGSSAFGGKGGAGASLCGALPPATGSITEVSPDRADELPRIVREAAPGTTILLADGTYRFTGSDEAARRIRIVADGVTLRSKSGTRDAVVIDGEYETEEIVTISASNVTLAELSIARAVNHLVHVTGAAGKDSTGALLYDLHLVDGGEQFVKVNPSGANPNTYADRGTLACSFLEMTATGREHVVPEPGGCYTGGIDGHQARGWAVRANEFRGIHCDNGSLAEHAVHFWTASRDTVVEQNLIVDCARGIGFGLGDGGGKAPDRRYEDDPYPGVGYVGHYAGIIRNNVIATSLGFGFFDTGIELEQARGTRVHHNTVVHAASAFASISHRFANTRVTLTNNLIQNVRARDGAVATSENNVEQAKASLFVDAAHFDFHLLASATAAVDQGVPLMDAGLDIDNAAHDHGAPDIGADELVQQ